MLQYLIRGIGPSEITTPLEVTHNFSGLSAMFSKEHSSKYTHNSLRFQKNFTALGRLFLFEWTLLSDKINLLTTEQSERKSNDRATEEYKW